MVKGLPGLMDLVSARRLKRTWGLGFSGNWARASGADIASASARNEV